MNNSDIHDKYEAEFNEFLRAKIETIKRQQEELESLLNGKHNLIPNIIELPSDQSLNPNGYKSVWTWKQKIIYFLEQGDYTTTEIVNSIIVNEPNLKSDRSKVVGSVSAVLSAKSKKPSDIFSKYQNERGLNIYKLNEK